MATTVLDWRQLAITQHVPEYLLLNAELSQVQDRLVDEMIYSLKKYILTDTFANDRYEQILRVPATSWQMFKREHATSRWLGWLVKRRPVKHETHTAVVEVRRMHTYPESTLQRERYMGRAYIHETTTPFWMEKPDGR